MARGINRYRTVIRCKKKKKKLGGYKSKGKNAIKSRDR